MLVPQELESVRDHLAAFLVSPHTFLPVVPTCSNFPVDLKFKDLLYAVLCNKDEA